MTVKDKIINLLESMGLDKDEAGEVFDLAKPEIESVIKNYKITWDRPSCEYHDSLYAIWMLTVKEHGLKWIEDNCPKRGSSLCSSPPSSSTCRVALFGCTTCAGISPKGDKNMNEEELWGIPKPIESPATFTKEGLKLKEDDIVFRIINNSTGDAVGSYSRAHHDVYDYSSASSARSANFHDIYQDRNKYRIAKYKVTYELIEDDCDE